MRFITAIAALSITLLSGCATRVLDPVAMGPTAVTPAAGRIGIAMVALPKSDTHLPGAGCLLCLAAASLANSSLTDHARKLPQDDLTSLKDAVAELVRKKGAEAVVLPGDLQLDALPAGKGSGPNAAQKDFSALQKQHNIDKLVIIEFRAVGFERTYASYFPTSDPKAVMRGVAYLVDLKSHDMQWYQPIAVLRSSDGAWDEAPKFPGLTNAYFQAIEQAKDEVLKPFKP